MHEPEPPSWAPEPFGPPAPDESPYVQPAPPPSHPGRRIGIAVVGTVAILAAAFGVVSLAQGDGASSAEGAVEDLFDAIGDEDAIGVMQAITPAERDVLRPALEDASGEARRIEVASDDLDLTDISGVEIDVEDLELTSSELGDGVVVVDVVGGTISSSVAIEDLPLGPVVREVVDQQDTEVDDTKGSAPLEGLKLVALERDGGWGVSLTYSIAEAVRRGADPEPQVPAFGQGIPERGAASPEAAVRELVTAATRLDVRRMIELTTADELGVLHDYGPLLVDAVDESEVDPSEGFSIDDLKLDVHDAADGRKVVEATSYAVSLGDDDDGMDITFDGRCTTVVTHWSLDYDSSFEDVGTRVSIDDDVLSYPDDPPPVPDDSMPEDDTTKTCIGEPDAVSPVGVFGSFGTGVAAPRIVVEEKDGAWYVAPVRTVFDTLLAGLRAVDAKDVRTITRVWTGDAEWLFYGEEFWEACGVDQPSASASEREGEAALEECFSADWEDDGPP